MDLALILHQVKVKPLAREIRERENGEGRSSTEKQTNINNKNISKLICYVCVCVHVLTHSRRITLYEIVIVMTHEPLSITSHEETFPFKNFASELPEIHEEMFTVSYVY